MMKKLFGGLKMKWITVILFAIITGVVTGLLMLVPQFENTSLKDIGISYECWIIFAIIIVVNCEKAWQAMLKCFVFFVISQPIIYLVEIVAGQITLNQAWHFYYPWWLGLTVATLPGGFIAYFCKKNNILGAIVLALGNTMLLTLGTAYVITTVYDFPHHLLSAVLCFSAVGILTFYIQKKAYTRIIAYTIPIVFTILLVVAAKSQGLYLVSGIF